MLLLIALILATVLPVAAEVPPPAEAPQPFVLGGYAEVFGQWNFNEPENGITNVRGFDNRHNSITLHNVSLSATWDASDVVGAIALQVGHAPSTYYLAEPALAGASGANATGAELFKYVQQANVGYRFPLLEGLLVSAGLYLSPIGPESVSIKDDWSWSRSNLFFGLPFYHAGARASLSVTERLGVAVMLTNGWNNIVDNNDAKSVMALVGYTLPDVLSAQLLYFGGAERARGAPEGDAAWRHLFDAFATWTPTPWLSLQAHGDVGMEPNAFGVSTWTAGALAARVQPLPFLFVAARVDAFRETAATGSAGTAARIFWPVTTLGSGTLTLDLRPVERVSFRLEARHDRADGDMFFRGDVDGDGVTTPFVPNARDQTTVTTGVVAWF